MQKLEEEHVAYIPVPFPVPLSYQPRALSFDCSKDLSSNVYNRLLLLCLFLLCFRSEFFFFFCVTGRHEIAFFFFFHLVCSYTSSAVIRTAYINNSCNKSCCIFISSLLGLAEKSL